MARESTAGDGIVKRKINYEFPDGTHDYFIIEGDTVEEIGQKAGEELSKRFGSEWWDESKIHSLWSEDVP